MLTYLKSFFNAKEIPDDIRLMTTATGIRWFGWGFAEALIPVLIFSFGNSFAEAGLIKASVDITFIMALPIIGMFADKIKSTTLIAIGLCLYLLVGFSYFMVGVTGMVIFIVIARLINGLSWGLDVVGRETYFRRHVNKKRVATAFGYFDTVADFWWIASAVMGIFLVRYFSITTLLFLITPTSFISLLIILKLRKKEKKIQVVKEEKSSINPLKEISDWSLMLKSIGCFNFLIAFAASVVAFFLPIETYKEGGSLTMVILIGIVSTLPTLSGWSLGKFFDAKGYKMLGTSLVTFSLLLMALSFLTSFWWRMVIMFIISLTLELISVGSNELITASAKPQHFGRVDGIMKSFASIGGMIGPFFVGILIDKTNMANAYISLAIVIFSLAVIFKTLDKRGFIEKYVVSGR